MRSYLSNFITTLSNRRQIRVGVLLDNARVSKDQINLLAQQLFSEFGTFAALSLSQEQVNSLITSGSASLNFRDAYLRISDLFRMSNVISLMLDSHSASLSSDIKAIEDELVALEKMAANYAFLLGDGKAYDYAFLEPFNDANGREPSFNFPIPDRAGQPFGPAEQGVILADQGVLTIPQMGRTHGIVGSILKGHTELMQNITNFENVYSSTSATGWSAVIKAPGPITSGILGVSERSGAQLLLEFSLSQPAPASQIKISPLADFALDVLQVTLYTGDSDDTANPLLDDVDSRTLTRPLTLSFPMQPVSRFRVLLCQPTYTRTNVLRNSSEEESRVALEEVKSRKASRIAPLGKETLRTIEDRFRRYRLTALGRKVRVGANLSDRQYKLGIPSSGNSWGVLNASHFLSSLQHRPSDPEQWNPQDALSKTFYRVAQEHIPELKAYMANWSDIDPYDPDFRAADAALSVPENLNPQNYNYQYRIGLSNVSIGADAPGFRGVFVSKSAPAPGDIGMTRIKTAQTNSFTTVVRDSRQVTSVEYSVTNRSDPQLETHWIPILPVSDTEVKGERFFPDTGGRGFLRFPADPVTSIWLYRNGTKLSLGRGANILGPGTTNIIGLTLPVGDYNLDDIFTVDYTPAGDQTTISFEAAGFIDEVPLVTAYDETGAGETYTTTVGPNEVSLRHTPYIDPAQAAASYYNQYFGHSTFQPIVVSMASGALATNLTNYSGGASSALPLADQGYYYRHAGRTLVFNQPASSFRVFYKYLENAVRFRVVLRVNDKNFVTPQVDFVHLKGKTRRPDPLSAQ